ncbi:MAG: AAA family ATPase [Mycobacterium sp.]
MGDLYSQAIQQELVAQVAAELRVDGVEEIGRGAFAPAAPATKCCPPVAVRSLVTRQKLMGVLRAAGRRRLILIHAPSGFGKTTLVEQWRAELTSSGVSVAWLTVDDDDNNVVWFLAHVLEAIRRVHPAVAASLGQALEERGEEAVRYVLTSLIDAVEENGTPVTLVIDDWQRVSHSQTIDALRFLIDHGSHGLQIIVNSWSRARLPLSKLRLRDELVEIDCEKLRFDADEAQSLLNDIAGLQLTGSDVAALTASTDGWVAALQLARLSLRGDGDPAGLLRRMSGDNEVAGEFLAKNVLDALEPELLDFLGATSITERTCGELASVLAGVGGGQDILEDVERRGLFLRRVDDDPQWFRYHQMFAGFLRRRLERDDPARLKHLHCTASDWFADHGYLSNAVDHALAAGETTRAVDLVEQDRTIGSVNQARMTTLLGIIEKLPPQLVNSRPRVHLSVAVANILLQRPAATEAALDRVTDCNIQGRPERGQARRSDPGGQRIARGGPDERRPGRRPGPSGGSGDIEAEDAAPSAAPGGSNRRGVRGDLPLRLRGSPSGPGMGGALRPGGRRRLPQLLGGHCR